MVTQRPLKATETGSIPVPPTKNKWIVSVDLDQQCYDGRRIGRIRGFVYWGIVQWQDSGLWCRLSGFESPFPS